MLLFYTSTYFIEGYINVQDSSNKVGIMTSKSTGEPPLLASVSVLTAFQAALAAAKQGLADMQGNGSARSGADGNSATLNGEAESNHNGASATGHQAAGKQRAAGSESVREQVLRQLQAPVTVKEVKRVVGELQLPELLLVAEE